jgi:hypothetical protein
VLRKAKAANAAIEKRIDKGGPMNSVRNRVLAIAAIALATIFASAIPASAQSMAYRGNFTLPNDVRWQGTTLPAGDYTFWMKSAASPAVIQLEGPKGGSFIASITVDKAELGDHSVITLERRAGMSVVRDLYLAETGVRVHYDVPKPNKDERLAQQHSTTEQILVAQAK